jgi:hypothetical protein
VLDRCPLAQAAPLARAAPLCRLPDVLRILRLTLAIGLALCLGLAFTPLGCGGSRGVEASSHGGEGPSVPDATIAELRACAEKSKARLKDTTYAFQFAVEVTEDGHADRVRLKDSFPGDDGMEGCMTRALEDMPVPLSVVQALSEQAEQAEAVSPESRGLMGNPFAAILGGAISLAPAVVTAAGVTFVVGVTIYLGKEAIKERRRKRRIREKCLVMYVACEGMGGLCTRPIDRDYNICSRCQANCENESSYFSSACVLCGFL